MPRSGQAQRIRPTRTRRPVDALASKIVAPQPSQQATFASHRDSWDALVAKMFEFGGDKLVMPQCPDTDLPAVLERGQVWTGRPKMRRGKPCNCHTNSAYLFEDGAGLIATGYALSEDGYWRQHSWVVSAEGRVIETTTPRQVYFGVLFTHEECIDWSNAQRF